MTLSKIDYRDVQASKTGRLLKRRRGQTITGTFVLLRVQLSDPNVQKAVGEFELIVLAFGLAYQERHGRPSDDGMAGGVTVTLETFVLDLQAHWTETKEGRQALAKDPTAKLTERRVRKAFERLKEYGLLSFEGRRYMPVPGRPLLRVKVTIRQFAPTAESVTKKGHIPGCPLIRKRSFRYAEVSKDAVTLAETQCTHGGKRPNAGRRPKIQAGPSSAAEPRKERVSSTRSKARPISSTKALRNRGPAASR